ncbi:hypothetical protein [Kineococcus sp. SYSU DK004]|uniref:hypothetical protein n=1 Tax=Kineococcus sp. SYSU DK004 TaxID=3383125 RepID=UPI003D7C707B
MSTSEDVIAAVDALAPLQARPDEDPAWSCTAEPTSWTAVRTVEHIADALVFYAAQVARRADRALPVLRDGRSGPASVQLDNVSSAAHLLAAALRTLGAERAWHPSGSADASGWAGMAVTELLVHGRDAAEALDLDLDPPAGLCTRVLTRVFPWVDQRLGPPWDLLLAVTGRAWVAGVPHDPQWWWQSAPLQEWDGRPRRRDSAPRWT